MEFFWSKSIFELYVLFERKLPLKNSSTRVFVQPGIFIFPEFFSGYNLRTNKNCRFFISTECLFPFILFELCPYTGKK